MRYSGGMCWPGGLVSAVNVTTLAVFRHVLAEFLVQVTASPPHALWTLGRTLLNPSGSPTQVQGPLLL